MNREERPPVESTVRLQCLAAAMLAALTLLVCAMPGARAAAQAPGANVLIVFSNNRLLPANIEFDRGLNEATDGTAHSPARLFAEFLDSPEFGGEAYEAETAAFLKEKYAARAPRVVVGAGTEALEFLLHHRAEMFPGAPIVHGAVDRATIKTLSLPTDVIGIPVDYDMRGTIELALRLHPTARRLVVVTGADQWSRKRRTDVDAAIESLRPGVAVEYLEGLPGSDLGVRLSKLPDEAIVIRNEDLYAAMGVNRRRTLTPDRRPILTPLSALMLPAEAGAAERERSSGGLGRRRAVDRGLSDCRDDQARCLNRQLSLPVSTMSQ